jgi:hypothetical protein
LFLPRFCNMHPPMRTSKQDFNFTVEEMLDGRPIAIHAGADNITVARLAYEAVKRELPRERVVTLCQRARVIKRSDQEQA